MPAQQGDDRGSPLHFEKIRTGPILGKQGLVGWRANRTIQRGPVKVDLKLIDLFHQVVLGPHLLDLIELCLQPVDVLFLIGKDRFEKLTSSVVADLDSQPDSVVVGLHRA